MSSYAPQPPGLAVEALEERRLLGFDAGLAGAIEHADYTRLATWGADSFYLENKRIGYMAANMNGVLASTSMSPADPQQVVSGARFFFKPLGASPYRFGTVTLKNSEARNIQAVYYWDEARAQFSTIHTDGVWFSNLISDDAANTSIFVFDNVSARDIEGREAFHFEGGSARRIYFRNTYAHNETIRGGARYTIKIAPGQVVRELIFENADLNATDTQRNIDQLVFEWNSKADPKNAAAYLPRIWVKNDGHAAITREYVIGRLKASGVPESVANEIVREGLPEDLNHWRASIDIGVTPRIEAEDFDFGREGLAYHDTSLANENGGLPEYRADVLPGDDLPKVDIRPTSDPGGGHEVTAVRAGEWMTYTIHVPTSGIYSVDARVQAGIDGGGTFSVEFDGLTTTGQLVVPADGQWSTQGASVFLSAGTHVMRIVAHSADGSSGWNLNWIELKRIGNATLTWPTGLRAVPEPWGLVRRDGGLPRVAEAWSGQIKLAWEDTPGEDAYIIERSTDGISGWLQVGRNAANQTTFSDIGIKGTASLGIDQGIQPQQTYHYRIRAVSGGASRVSDLIRVTTPAIPYTAEPSAPSDLLAERYLLSPLSGAVQLTWRNTSTTAKGFFVERRAVGETAFTRLWPIGAVGGINTFIDTDPKLTAGVSYEYRVIAYNWLGESTPSDIVQLTTPTKIAAVAAPSNLNVVALNSGAIQLTWTDNSDNEMAFEIRRSGDGMLFATLPATPGVGNNLSAVLGMLSIPNTYRFFIRAVNIDHAADSTSSGSVFAAAQPQPPVGVTNLSAYAIGDAISRGIELWWSAVAAEVANDVAVYKIERSVDGQAWIEIGTTAADGRPQYRFIDRALAPNTNVYYRVRTYNRSGGLSNPELSAVIRAATGAFSRQGYSLPTVGQTIQLEDFDRGGDGIAYHDSSDTNQGTLVYHRKPDGNAGWIADPSDAGVDIASDGLNTWVTQTQPGEWLSYTLYAHHSGLYQLQLRARINPRGTFHVEVNGIDRSGPLTGNGSGEWQIITIPSFAINAGEHVLRIVMDGQESGGSIGDFDAMHVVERLGLYSERGALVIDGGYNATLQTGPGQTVLISGGTGADELILSSDQFQETEVKGTYEGNGRDYRPALRTPTAASSNRTQSPTQQPSAPSTPPVPTARPSRVNPSRPNPAGAHRPLPVYLRAPHRPHARWQPEILAGKSNVWPPYAGSRLQERLLSLYQDLKGLLN